MSMTEEIMDHIYEISSNPDCIRCNVSMGLYYKGVTMIGNIMFTPVILSEGYFVIYSKHWRLNIKAKPPASIMNILSHGNVTFKNGYVVTASLSAQNNQTMQYKPCSCMTNECILDNDKLEYDYLPIPESGYNYNIPLLSSIMEPCETEIDPDIFEEVKILAMESRLSR